MHAQPSLINVAIDFVLFCCFFLFCFSLTNSDRHTHTYTEYSTSWLQSFVRERNIYFYILIISVFVGSIKNIASFIHLLILFLHNVTFSIMIIE